MLRLKCFGRSLWLKHEPLAAIGPALTESSTEPLTESCRSVTFSVVWTSHFSIAENLLEFAVTR